ncbi:MAG: SpoVG family protein [Candidatus Eisenbacteria bacterium]
MLELTEIRVHRIRVARLRALVNVVVDGALVIRGIKVIEGPDRLFLAWPSRPREDGRYEDVVHPVTMEARTQIEEAVLAAYDESGGFEDAGSGARLRPPPTPRFGKAAREIPRS